MRSGVDVDSRWVVVGADILAGISVVATGTGVVVGIGASVDVEVGGIWVAVGLGTGTVWVSSPSPPQPAISTSSTEDKRSNFASFRLIQEPHSILFISNTPAP